MVLKDSSDPHVRKTVITPFNIEMMRERVKNRAPLNLNHISMTLCGSGTRFRA
jgi:hypothetical protein